jgi:hypothetical protein
MIIKQEDLENLVHYVKVPNVTVMARHILDRTIRRIHSRNEFGVTDLVETKLKEFNLYKNQPLTKSRMTGLNRKLKKMGFDDIVTIEHLYSVKKMVDDLLSMREKFDDKTDDKVVYEYLVNKTHCVYKFYKAEKELHG